MRHRLLQTVTAILVIATGAGAGVETETDSTTGRDAKEGEPVKRGAAKQWMADVPEGKWLYLVLHHSGTESGSLASIHAEHRRRLDSAGQPWLGIGYHFVIGNGQGIADGQVVPTFRWKEQISGAHSGDAVFNTRGIGICLIGNFEKQPPSARQLAAVKDLVAVLSHRHRIARSQVMGHSSIRSTSCPGQLFPLAEVRGAVFQATEG